MSTTIETPYPDSEQSTLQRYFDKALAHLRSMPRRAVDSHGSCVYHNAETDAKCVVGAFLPVDHVARHVDGGVTDLAEYHPELAGIAWPAGGRGHGFASELQEIHDHGSNWDAEGFGDRGEMEAENLARGHGLNYSPRT